MTALKRHSVGPVDAMVMAATVASAVWWVSLTPHSWFYVDDWQLAYRSLSVTNLVRPYNNSLALVLGAIYRALFGIFGFSTYLPFRILGASVLAAVSVSVYVVARRVVTPGIAAIIAFCVLWPTSASLQVAAINTELSFIAAAVCAVLLDRPSTRKSDLALGVLLAFALAAGPNGVAAAAACLVFAAITRAGGRRWLAIGAPVAMWGLWWITMARRARDATGLLPPASPNFHSLAASVWHSLVNTLEFAGRGSPVGSAVVVVIVVARIAYAARRPWTEAANLIAWSIAAITWWIGLARYRQETFGIPLSRLHNPRYDLISFGLVILALLPRRSDRPLWSGVHVRDRHLRAGTLVFVPMAGVLLYLTGVAAARQSGDFFNTLGTDSHTYAILTSMGPSVLPHPERPTFYFYNLSTNQVRETFDRFGGMPTTPRGQAKALADMITVSGPGPAQRNDPCTEIRRLEAIQTGTPIVVTARDGAVVFTVATRTSPAFTLFRVSSGTRRVIELPVTVAYAPFTYTNRGPGRMTLQQQGSVGGSCLPAAP